MSDLVKNPDSQPPANLVAELTDGVTRANHYHSMARLGMAQSCASMIMCGLELEQLKKSVGHGGWQSLFSNAGQRLKGTGAAANATPLLHFEFTDNTARRYIAIAEASRKRIDEIRGLPLDTTPLAMLTDEQKDLLEECVAKKTDGQTYASLAKEWGLARKPKLKGGHHPGQNSKPAGAEAERIIANDRAEALITALRSFQQGQTMAFADAPLLTELEAELSAFGGWFPELLKKRRTTDREHAMAAL